MWSKREQTAGRGCRLSPSAPVDDPPMYIFIYFIAFPNKRSYNYSTPRAASTAHFNVNPTKKVKRMKARWRLYLHAGSPLLCSTSQVRFASVCLTEAPPGVTHLCPEREREMVARSFEPVGGVWCLPWSRICGVFDLESWILTSPAFVVCVEDTRSCAHVRRPLESKEICFFFSFFNR